MVSEENKEVIIMVKEKRVCVGWVVVFFLVGGVVELGRILGCIVLF